MEIRNIIRALPIPSACLAQAITGPDSYPADCWIARRAQNGKLLLAIVGGAQDATKLALTEPLNTAPERWMRDPNRIGVLLEAVRRVWSNRPDLRLGQLLVIAVQPKDPCPAIFYAEDDTLLQRLESMATSADGPGSIPQAAQPDLPWVALRKSFSRRAAVYVTIGAVLGVAAHWSVSRGPSTYADCVMAASARPTEEGVHLAFDACGRKFFPEPKMLH